MINGQLGCIGASSHLKKRFGKGFEIDVRFDPYAVANHKKEIPDATEE